jgi:hypothetical protein
VLDFYLWPLVPNRYAVPYAEPLSVWVSISTNCLEYMKSKRESARFARRLVIGGRVA